MALGPAVLQPDAPDVRPLFQVGPIAQFTERQIEMEAQPLRIMVDDVWRLWPGSRCSNNCPMMLCRKRGSISATSITRSFGPLMPSPAIAPGACAIRPAPARK